MYTIMECLRDYIGIKGCSLTVPDSQMYINTLPGIEFKNIEQLANAEQVDFQGVWDDVQDRAVERFRLDILGKYSGFDQRYRLRQITQSVDLGKDLTSGVTQVPSANNSGLVLELMNPGDACICSNMQSFYIQSIQFYCVNAGAYVITVKDADYGTVLDTFSVVGVQGWNVTKSDAQYDGVRRISITVDTTALTTAFLDLSNFNLQLWGGNNWCSDCYGWNGVGLFFNYDCAGNAQVRGYQTDATFQNPVYGVNTFGVSAVFSVKCTYNNIVCNNKRFFATAFRLALGIELMMERIYTSRLNRWTTVDKQQARDLKKEYELQYRGGVMTGANGGTEAIYEGELQKACDSIDLDLSDCCLECDAPIVWRETQM